MKRKTRLKIGIIIAIVCVMGFSNRSFADDIEKTGIKVFGITLSFIVSVASWLWVFLANIAGEFLTNKWVYGEFLGLDVLLRKYRNVVKNFANFGLGLYFVYIIFKGLISTGKDGIEQTLKNNILWLVIAGIGIQASWFFTAFFIDLSTVTLAAAGSFPSSVMSNSTHVETSLKNRVVDLFGDSKNKDQYNKVKVLDLFKDDSKVSEFLNIYDAELDTSVSIEGLLDTILPSANNVSGPLYFMGFSILNTNSIPSLNNASEEGFKESILNTIIQGGTTLVYAIELLVLCVIAIIRILYLWMFIILSPIAILLRCIKQTGQKTGGDKGFIEKLNKTLNIESFMINVFKPTIVVLGLGIAVIITSLMTDIIKNNSNTTNNNSDASFTFRGVTFSSTKDPGTNGQSPGDATYTTTMSNDLFSFTLEHVGKPLLEIVLSILTIFLVYGIIKLAVKIGNGNDFVGKSIDSLQKGVGDVLTKTPFIPVAGYDEKGQPTTHYMSAGAASTLIDEVINKYDGKVKDEYGRQNDIIRSWFSNNITLKSDDKRAVEQKSDTEKGLSILTTQMNEIKKLGDNDTRLSKGSGYGMILNPSASDPWWQRRFTKWLEDMNNRSDEINKGNIGEKNDKESWTDMIKRWNAPENKDTRTLENLFKKSNNFVKAYAKLFNLGNITSWEKLKDADFSEKK